VFRRSPGRLTVAREERPTYKERWMNRSSAINPPTALRSRYMQMRKSILAATAAAAMLLPLAAATVAEAAPTATHDVLTISKVGGANVKAKATLSAGLPKKGVVDFSIGPSSSPTLTAKCPTASLTFSVTKNPAKPGSASLDLTKAPVGGKCKFGGELGADVSSLSASLKKEPYAATISDGKGDPVTISNETVKVVVKASVGTLTCYFSAKTVKGSYSNKTNGITFKDQTMKLASGGSSDCSAAGTSATYSATFSPLKDSSVKGSPKVFLN
jgi:hypothetical protein